MRFKTFYLLNESPIFNKEDKIPKDKRDDDWGKMLTSHHIGYKQPTSKVKINNMLFGVYKNGNSTMYVGFKNDNTHQSNAVIFCGGNINKKFGFFQPSYVEVKSDHEAKGLASNLYDYFVSTYGGVISDISVSESVLRVYTKLSKKYNGYLLDGKYNIISDKKELTASDVGKYDYFLISKDELGDEWNKLDESILLERPDAYVGNAMPDEYVLSEFTHYDKYSKYKSMKDDEYEYRNYSNNAWFVMKDGKPISMCVISKKPSYAQIIATSTISKMKNKGVASKLYSKMINEYGGVLSDGSLSKNKTGGSWFLYEKLIKQYPSYSVDMTHGAKYKSLTSISSMPESNESTRILLSKNKRTETKLD